MFLQTFPHLESEVESGEGADADVLTDLGAALIDIGLDQEAESRFRQALAEHPGHFHALFNLGGLLLTNGRSEEALVHLRHARMIVDILIKKFPELAIRAQ